MKKLIFVLTLMLCISFGYAQELIDEAKISLLLPNGSWKIADKIDQNEMQAYIYLREPIIDSIGREVISNIAVVVEDVDEETDVINYSILKRLQMSMKVVEMFTHEDGLIDFQNALGYKFKYNDVLGEHTCYVVYGINNKKGIQIIFDVTTELFDSLDAEFKITLKSIKIEE